MPQTGHSAEAAASLSAGGRSLWAGVADHHELDAIQLVQLLEACRAKDRLDKMNLLLCGDLESWSTLVREDTTGELVLRIDGGIALANATANMMKQLLASLRLPDAQGKKPQYRGTRGAYVPQKTSALDRLQKAS